MHRSFIHITTICDNVLVVLWCVTLSLFPAGPLIASLNVLLPPPSSSDKYFHFTVSQKYCLCGRWANEQMSCRSERSTFCLIYFILFTYCAVLIIQVRGAQI